MRAVILAGGMGRRLEPYTISFPKPLAPVGDLPILEIVVRQLATAGFRRLTMAVGHLAELIVAYFGDGSKWGIAIDYSREERPLGTVGPLKLLDDLPDRFLVLNGDVLTTLAFDRFFAYHASSGAALTIASHRCTQKIDYGILEFDGRLLVTGYREKPCLSYDVSMGVYAFNRNALELVERGERYDLPQLVLGLIARQQPVKVYVSDDVWLDIGRPDDYAQASKTFAELRDEFLPPRRLNRHHVAPAAVEETQ